jgi:hypothetical protein
MMVMSDDTSRPRVSPGRVAATACKNYRRLHMKTGPFEAAAGPKHFNKSTL